MYNLFSEMRFPVAMELCGDSSSPDALRSECLTYCGGCGCGLGMLPPSEEMYTSLLAHICVLEKGTGEESPFARPQGVLTVREKVP